MVSSPDASGAQDETKSQASRSKGIKTLGDINTACCAEGALRQRLETAGVVAAWFFLNISIASSTKWIFVHGNICIKDGSHAGA